MVALAAEAHPEAEVSALLDCADKPGLVLAALRHGVRAVRFTGSRTARTKLSAIAAASGAEIVSAAPRALDLRGLADPEAACATWLATGRKPREGRGDG